MGEAGRGLNGDASMKEWLVNENYYDEKYRVIQTVADNQCPEGPGIPSRDITTSNFSFTGRVNIQKTNHTSFSQSIEFVERYRYDHR
jgi:hypothetical protein